MAIRIIPRIIRGNLFFQIADVLFPTFAQAAGAWSAAVTDGFTGHATASTQRFLP